MKIKTISLVFLIVLLAGLLSGCTGMPLASSWPGVTSESDMIYVSFNSFVHAVNGDGTVAWVYPAEADRNRVFYAAPAVMGDQVFVGDFKNVFYSLNRQTGAENWTFTEAKDRYIGKPLAVESQGLVLAPNADHNLYALNGSGQLQWKFTTGDPIWAQPVTDGDRAYAASMDGYLYAIDLNGGSQIWSTNLEAAVVYSLAISEDGTHVYAGTLGNEMVSVDAQTGTVAWRHATESGVWGRAVLYDDLLIFGDEAGKVYALNAADGEQRWSVDAGGSIISSGAVMGEQGIAFPTEDAGVVAIDFNGTKVWTQPVNGKLYSNPVYTGDRLVVPVTQGEENLLMVALNANGTQAWAYNQP